MKVPGVTGQMQMTLGHISMAQDHLLPHARAVLTSHGSQKRRSEFYLVGVLLPPQPRLRSGGVKGRT